MIARGRGRIVNVTSGVGTRAYPFMSAYCLGKTALIRFTECVAAEIRATAVKVFSVSPGMVRTDMIGAVVAHPRSKEWFPWAHENIAAGKDWPPETSARLILRLASGEADSLSGRHITVADDLGALIARAGEAAETQALMLRLSTLA
jgi:NAD(P)-dependent dehydrogenase (short-subunit alcohol dehydrogenase family)